MKIKIMMLKTFKGCDLIAGRIYPAEEGEGSTSAKGIKLNPAEYVIVRCCTCAKVGACGNGDYDMCKGHDAWSPRGGTAFLPIEPKSSAQDLETAGAGKYLLADPDYKAVGNMMPAICKNYGLEWNEVTGRSNIFKLNERQGSYRLSRAISIVGFNKGMPVADSSTLMQILSGELTIKKERPFAKPVWGKEDESYQYVSAACGVCRTNAHSTLFYYLRKAGNMFALNAVLPQKQIDAIVAVMKGEPEK